jgi:hypothetical protein
VPTRGDYIVKYMAIYTNFIWSWGVPLLSVSRMGQTLSARAQPHGSRLGPWTSLLVALKPLDACIVMWVLILVL